MQARIAVAGHWFRAKSRQAVLRLLSRALAVCLEMITSSTSSPPMTDRDAVPRRRINLLPIIGFT